MYNMLDLFTIFSKSGLVLWCFQGASQSFTSPVNALIKSVILQERGSLESFTHEALALKYKLDNEFELVFVVAYQKFLKLSYVDKFLSDIQIEFRNKYKVSCPEFRRRFSLFTVTFWCDSQVGNTYRSSALSFAGAKRPQGELSLSWNFRSVEH